MKSERTRANQICILITARYRTLIIALFIKSQVQTRAQLPRVNRIERNLRCNICEAAYYRETNGADISPEAVQRHGTVRRLDGALL